MTQTSIALSSLNETFDVNVEGLGIIKVKKESSNQGLKRSEHIRDIFKLQDESKRLDKKVKKLIADGVDENDPQIVKLTEEGTAKLDKITEVSKAEHEMRRSRLSDDEGGKLVEKLFDSASDEDIAKLFAIADGTDKKVEDAKAD